MKIVQEHQKKSMNRMLGLALLGVFAVALAMPVAAANSAQDGGDRPPPMDNPALKAALDSCVASAGKDSRGGPDHKAVDACMKAKGFSPPQGGPPHGGQPPQGFAPPPEGDAPAK